MDDIRIPCIVWLRGDPPPDLSGISDPIRIPFTLRPRAMARPDLPTDYHAVESGPFAEAHGGLRLRFEDPPAIARPPGKPVRTDASNPCEPESELPSRAHASPGRPGGNGRAPLTRDSRVFAPQHPPPSGSQHDDWAPDEG